MFVTEVAFVPEVPGMSVEITLLGRFAVFVGGAEIPTQAWSRRRAAGLVKLLALAPHRRLQREQVIDALWPGLTSDDAGPRLHKAAHSAGADAGLRGERGSPSRVWSNLVMRYAATGGTGFVGRVGAKAPQRPPAYAVPFDGANPGLLMSPD